MHFKSCLAGMLLLSGCAFFGVDGQHNAWKEFQDRCIQPIAQHQTVRTAGLEQGSSQNIEQRLRALQDPGDTYWYPKNTLWVLQTNKDANRCTIYAKGRGTQVAARGEAWLAESRKAGSFLPDHYISSEGTLHFQDGRTAYIQVQLEDHNEFMKHAMLVIVPE